MRDQLFTGSFWQFGIFNNTVYDYLLALGIFVALVAGFKLLQWVVLRSLKRVTQRTRTEFDDALVTIVQTVKPPFYSYVSFYVALQYLNIEGIAERIVSVILITWLVYQVVVALHILIDFYVERRLAGADKGAAAATHVIHSLSGVVLWLLGALFVLQNVGVNVTSLIAGLGIGGIAVALAAQNILGDLFSSLAIYFDKPFVPGDVVSIGEHKGTIKKIGIKTTRITSLDGDEIVVPNTEITGSALKNVGRMKDRRVVFTFGVTYETSGEKLERIPSIVRQVIEGREQAEFDRAHFTEFADSALIYEVVYHIEGSEFQVYRDTHQEILLAIKKTFENEGIDMAYPTRTVYTKAA